MTSSQARIGVYLDEDIHPDLADAIRQNGFDCQNAAEAGMLGKLDVEQLEHATSQGRCLVSFNVRHFTVLAQQWAHSGRAHAGIVVTKQVSRRAFGQLLGRILHLLNTTTAAEIKNVLRYL
jgi:hypothetical protein